MSKSTRQSKGAVAGPTDDDGSPKINPEDFIEALLDQRVLDAITKVMTPLTKALEASLSKRLDAMAITLRSLREDNGRLSEQCKTLVTENADLKRLVADNERRIDDLERYSRSDNLIIRGLPESSFAERATTAPPLTDGSALQESHSSVEMSLINFVKDALKIDIQPSDISTAHRIKAGPKDSTRPVIVRFTKRRVRNLVYGAKKMLKGSTSRIFMAP